MQSKYLDGFQKALKIVNTPTFPKSVWPSLCFRLCPAQHLLSSSGLLESSGAHAGTFNYISISQLVAARIYQEVQ